MTNPKPLTIDLVVDTGGAMRMAFLMTHYRKPIEMGDAKRAYARKVLRRFALACEPCLDGPPIELVETLANDLNTPGCIALLHEYRANKHGKKLFASLRFLGFWGGICLPDELATLPPDPIWAVQVIGLPSDAVHDLPRAGQDADVGAK